jgi:hypothetical protein
MTNITRLLDFRNDVLETFEKTQDKRLLFMIHKAQSFLATYGDMTTYFIYLHPDSVHERFLEKKKAPLVQAQINLFEINGDLCCLVLSEYI